MKHAFLTESSIHYIAALLDRTNDKYGVAKQHVEAIKEFRALSNKLLETLEEPYTLNVIRHNL